MRTLKVQKNKVPIRTKMATFQYAGGLLSKFLLTAKEKTAAPKTPIIIVNHLILDASPKLETMTFMQHGKAITVYLRDGYVFRVRRRS